MSRSSVKAASVRATDKGIGSHLAAAYPDNLFWRVIIDGFAWLWASIKWFWTAVVLFLLANFLIALLTTGLNDATDPQKWLVVLLAKDHLLRAAGVLLLAAALAFCAYRAARIKEGEPDANLAAEYVLKRVHRLDTSDGSYVPLYKPVYLRREADEVAQKALRRAARRTMSSSSEEPIGICVFGRPTLGKTRLTWEVMQATLPDWTFVRWPYRHDQPFDFAAQRGRRVILWLDDLQQFASSGEIATLRDLPSRFASGGTRLVIVATCRDGDDETRVRKELNAMLRRLTVVRPASISPAQADRLAKKLQRRGFAAKGDQFDGTPGSLLLGVEGMGVRYLDLPEPARRLLQAMKLLRSIGIYRYPQALLTETVEEVFGLAGLPWRAARDALLSAGFVRLQVAETDDERPLAPVADAYLEQCVMDYPPPGAAIRDDWPKLEQSFARRQNADMLRNLGGTFREERLGNLRANKQHAAACFRTLLEIWTREQHPRTWAWTQKMLGDALREEADLAEGSAQSALMEAAMAAYRAALEVRHRDSDPDGWATIQVNVGLVLGHQAEQAEGSMRLALLDEAAATYKAALEVYTRETYPADWARVQNNLGIVLRYQAEWAESGKQLALLQGAVACYRAALSVYSRESEPDGWAGAQGNLSAALKQQAELLDGKERAKLLEEAIQACQAALKVFTRGYDPLAWAKTRCNLGAIFWEQTRWAVGAEAALLLIQAEQAFHAGLQVITRDYAPDDWARTQFMLGNVFGSQADLNGGKKQEALFARAVEAYHAAMEVWKRDDAPDSWAMAQLNLCVVLKDQGELAQGEKRIALLHQAITAGQAVLEVRKRRYAPALWAETRLWLADAYIALAATLITGDTDERCHALRSACRCAQCALSVFSEEVAPSFNYQATQIIKTTREALERFGCEPIKKRASSKGGKRHIKPTIERT